MIWTILGALGLVALGVIIGAILVQVAVMAAFARGLNW